MTDIVENMLNSRQKWAKNIRVTKHSTIAIRTTTYLYAKLKHITSKKAKKKFQSISSTERVQKTLYS